MKKAAREEPLSFQYRRQANKNEVLLFFIHGCCVFVYFLNSDVTDLVKKNNK